MLTIAIWTSLAADKRQPPKADEHGLPVDPVSEDVASIQPPPPEDRVDEREPDHS